MDGDSVGANLVKALRYADLPHADKPDSKTRDQCLAGMVKTIRIQPNSNCSYSNSDRIIKTTNRYSPRAM